MTDAMARHIRIECIDGIAWKTKVTVDGVVIPCTSVTWTAGDGDMARAVLEVPGVLIDAEVKAALVKVVEVDAPAPDNSPEAVVERYRAAGGLHRG